MALGIDSAAHEGALSVDGKTIAVLGSGLDIIYPCSNKSLYEKIAKNNMVISELRLGKEADKTTFPIRNRIIAGMCSHTIVVESDTNGGSMITANLANEYGRTVMAVPGRVGQSVSRGCHDLIRDGAILVSDISHIIEELDHAQQQLLSIEKQKEIDVYASLQDPVGRSIVGLLREKGPSVPDDISLKLEIPIHSLLSRLQLLELRHFVCRSREGLYACYYP
jgi:DNA processing protein